MSVKLDQIEDLEEESFKWWKVFATKFASKIGVSVLEFVTGVIRDEFEITVRRIKMEVLRTGTIHLDGETNEQLVDGVGRVPYITKEVLATAPQSPDGDYDYAIVFPKKRIACRELATELVKDGWEMTTPDILFKVATDNPAIADEYPIAVQWQDENRNYCYSICYRDDGERRVGVNRYDDDWGDNYAFCCRRKKVSTEDSGS